jgi:hypothetical protein
VVVRIFQGRGAAVHPLMYLAAAGFAVYFLIPLLQDNFDWI